MNQFRDLHGLSLLTINRQFRGNQIHIRDALKLHLLKQYVLSDVSGYINMSQTTWDGHIGKWHMVYDSYDEKHYTIAHLLSTVMFDCVDSVENVYFFRNMNVCRRLLSHEQWLRVVDACMSHTSTTLNMNISRYLEYERKYQECCDMIANLN